MPDNKSATNVVASLISLFVPGLGQLVQMRLCRALAYFFTALVVTVVSGVLLPFLVPWLFRMGATAFFLPTLVVGVFAAYDAVAYSSVTETLRETSRRGCNGNEATAQDRPAQEVTGNV